MQQQSQVEHIEKIEIETANSLQLAFAGARTKKNILLTTTPMADTQAQAQARQLRVQQQEQMQHVKATGQKKILTPAAQRRRAMMSRILGARPHLRHLAGAMGVSARSVTAGVHSQLSRPRATRASVDSGSASASAVGRRALSIKNSGGAANASPPPAAPATAPMSSETNALSLSSPAAKPAPRRQLQSGADALPCPVTYSRSSYGTPGAYFRVHSECIDRHRANGLCGSCAGGSVCTGTGEECVQDAWRCSTDEYGVAACTAVGQVKMWPTPGSHGFGPAPYVVSPIHND